MSLSCDKENISSLNMLGKNGSMQAYLNSLCRRYDWRSEFSSARYIVNSSILSDLSKAQDSFKNKGDSSRGPSETSFSGDPNIFFGENTSLILTQFQVGNESPEIKTRLDFVLNNYFDSDHSTYDEIESSLLSSDITEIDLTMDSPPKTPKKQSNIGDKSQTSAKTPNKSLTTPQRTQFSRGREENTQKLFQLYNKNGFHNQLPADLSIRWSKRLLSTAGITRLRTVNSIKTAEIELSIKVIDSDQKLQDTLLHEMCHVAAFLLDGVSKPPHGNCFWKWAEVVMAGVEGSHITTCHSYVVHKPFKYICTDENCKREYGRHSKKGIDIDRHRCGECQGKLRFMGTFNADGTPKKSRELNAFSTFVQANFSHVKSSHCGSTHKDIMNELAKMYKDQKLG